MLFGAAMLQLAEITIPVRLVVNTRESMFQSHTQLQADVRNSMYVEQFIVLEGFSAAEVKYYRNRYRKFRTHRISVGTFQAYLEWLQTRLGPLGTQPVDSPVRQFTEHLLCAMNRAEPVELVPLERIIKKTGIDKQLQQGALGVQSIATLLGHTLGACLIENVEQVKSYQAQGFDLLVQPNHGREKLKVEVKAESYNTGNIVLETFSCYWDKRTDSPHNTQTLGWFATSKADVLVTIIWLTGDVLIMDLNRVRQWVKETPEPLELRMGTVPNQNYCSQFYLTPIERIMAEVPGVIHLQLADWLPALYGKQFKEKCKVAASLARGTLPPQRLGA